MVERPLIGLTADFENREAGPTEAEYVLRANYTSAVVQAGGLPIILPHDAELAAIYVSRIDGLIVTGGMFDIHPNLYGEKPTVPLKVKVGRTDFEMALLDAALTADLPILGICNGMQLLAVKLGGSLIQDIQRDVPDGIEHLPHPVPDNAFHGIIIPQDSPLLHMAKKLNLSVNSLHHQAVLPGGDYEIAACSSEDGVVEAINAKNKTFCMGVQWHPEYHTCEIDTALFEGFVGAASAYNKTRKVGESYANSKREIS